MVQIFRIKILILYSQKFHRTKFLSFRKWRNQTLFCLAESARGPEAQNRTLIVQYILNRGASCIAALPVTELSKKKTCKMLISTKNDLSLRPGQSMNITIFEKQGLTT